jgi:hypothetical protein
MRCERVEGYRMFLTDVQEARTVSSGYIPSKDEPGPDEIVEALREAIFDNPRLAELPAEEIARQLVLDGWLQQEPSPVLVAEMLDALEAEEEGFEADELSEEGNPT